MSAPWTFDELKFAGEEHLGAAQVAAYDRKAAFDPGPELRLLRELGLGQDSALVDVGAGTGELALAAAAVCRRVVAVDVSPAMLELLTEKAAAQGRTNVETVGAGFLGWSGAGDFGERFDFAYSRNALHHLPDFWKVQALRRLHGALRPGGVLRLRDLAFSFPPGETEARLEGWLDQASGDRGGVPRTELEAHLRGEFSTFAWLLEPMLEGVGFVIEAARYSPSGIFAAYVCRRPA